MATTVTQALLSKTETTISIKWTSNSTIDYIWYSSNGGTSWTGINVTDGTSGSYTISGLTANTTYTIKTRVRNKSTQATTDSSGLSVATYNYPYATTMPSFTIGEKITIKLYNPLGRTCVLTFIGADGSNIGTDNVTSSQITGYNGTNAVNRLYASIPNAKSGTYSVRVTYGSSVITKTGGTYTIDEAVCKPTITSGAYADTNSTTIVITGNNQNIIQNESVVRYTASGVAANYSASISSVTVKVNGTTYSLPVSGTTATGGNAVIDSGTDLSAVFTVTDSRGLTATKTVTISMIPLSAPTAVITMERESNYYAATDITVDATYSSVNNYNSVTIGYVATRSDSGATVSGSLTDGVTSTVTLDNNYSWTVVFTITDRFSNTTTYTLKLSRGIPLVFFDTSKSSVGINCFPELDESFEVNGVDLSKNIMSRDLTSSITSLNVSSYTIIPLDGSDSVGSKLTAESNGGIEIGAGVSKVLISGRVNINAGSSSGSRMIRICKNSISNTLAWAAEYISSGASGNLVVTPILADVDEGDVIYMYYYVPLSTDTVYGYTMGNRTSMTVEVVA